MNKNLYIKILLFVVSISFLGCNTSKTGKLIFVCSENNDLYNALVDSKEEYQRFSSADQAIEAATTGSGILVLSDNYPYKKVTLSDDFFEKVKKKKIRLYIEFPASLPGLETGDIQQITTERAVVTSSVFGDSLEKMRIVMLHDCHYVEVSSENPHLVIAKVAGYDEAIFGLDSTKTNPILFKQKNADILVATTKLSQFVTARYAPKDAWKPIWNYVFKWASTKYNRS